LTSFILKQKPKKIFVIEKDDNLAKNLNENFGEQLTIINDDILNIDENSLFDEKGYSIW
jgi:16S rRNA (adenine1518-N6/adenine1519-N6)-dimethyltransferase